jgi:putative FmdB family regulatory protein
MPTYVYRREDGSTFELVQPISEDALTVDPETGQKVQRVISGACLIFKGSGFYLTDYKNANGKPKEEKADKSESTVADAKPAVTESKPDKATTTAKED